MYEEHSVLFIWESPGAPLHWKTHASLIHSQGGDWLANSFCSLNTLLGYGLAIRWNIFGASQQRNVWYKLGGLTSRSWEWKGWAPYYQCFLYLYRWICCFYSDIRGQRQAWDCFTCWNTCRWRAPSCFPFRQGWTCGGWPCYGKHESFYHSWGCYWKLWYAVIYQRNGWGNWFWRTCRDWEVVK